LTALEEILTLWPVETVLCAMQENLEIINVKSATSCGGSRPLLIQFLRPTIVHIPNGIWIGSAVFAGITIIADKQSYFIVSSNMLHLASAAMWPNNITIMSLSTSGLPSNLTL